MNTVTLFVSLIHFMKYFQLDCKKKDKIFKFIYFIVKKKQRYRKL